MVLRRVLLQLSFCGLLTVFWGKLLLQEIEKRDFGDTRRLGIEHTASGGSLPTIGLGSILCAAVYPPRFCATRNRRSKPPAKPIVCLAGGIGAGDISVLVVYRTYNGGSSVVAWIVTSIAQVEHGHIRCM
ncbi:hypothetical protein FN846DRAFT_996019 [Sphaerosporella brunnea]|uniref:Uncharacterized protein n=1 Tax=Sphaerosporella brunnea TaxID=1250544 RepID=A0A5J5F722_9PEZI|nr:hypothetical protein FN846DRAFT_996019 [Sphaerosporella brunnea]